MDANRKPHAYIPAFWELCQDGGIEADVIGLRLKENVFPRHSVTNIYRRRNQQGLSMKLQEGPVCVRNNCTIIKLL